MPETDIEIIKKSTSKYDVNYAGLGLVGSIDQVGEDWWDVRIMIDGEHVVATVANYGIAVRVATALAAMTDHTPTAANDREQV